MGKDRKDKTIVDPRDSAQVYDSAAADFHKRAPNLVSYENIVRPSIERNLDRFFPGDRSQAKVLDVGSASARNEFTLQDLGFSPENMLGVEISPKQVEIARQVMPQATFEVGDISEHHLEAGRNDLVLEIMVAEFLDNDKRKASLKRIYDSMADGGVYVCVTTHPDRYEAKHGVADGEVETQGPWDPDAKFTNYVRPVERQVQDLKDAGFKVEVVEELYLPDKAKQEHPEFTYADAYARLTLVGVKSSQA